MSRIQVLEWIERIGVVPVVRAHSAEQAIEIGEAVTSGGITILEITMTVPGAVSVVRELRERFGDTVLIGAGTVLSARSAEECLRAGAQFIVSPCLDLETVRFCNLNEVVVAPGALTPTEIYSAWTQGADVVKVFPASAVGGPGYLKSLAGPFPKIRVLPTGGVTLENAPDFIKAGAVAVGVGSELTGSNIGASDMTRRAKTLLQAVRAAREN